MSKIPIVKIPVIKITMTNNEAIKLLEEFECIDDWSAVYMPTLHDAIDLAIEALMRQIPRKPGQDKLGDDYHVFPICPNCCTGLDDAELFCPNCGQAILWKGKE